MTFQEFKTQLSSDLWEAFTKYYYIYDSDYPQAVGKVKDQITTLIEGMKVMDDDISLDELDQLINDLVPFIYKSQIGNLTQDDLDYWGECFWTDLTRWASKDSHWYDREIGGIYDESVEGGLYAK